MPPLWATTVIRVLDNGLYRALLHSANSSNKEIYEYALGLIPPRDRGFVRNKLKGAAGEAVAYDNLSRIGLSLHGIIGNGDWKFNHRHNGKEVDLSETTDRIRYSSDYPLPHIHVSGYVKGNTFSGGKYEKIYDPPKIGQVSPFTVNYEIKTTDPNQKKTSSLFKTFSRGIEQTNLRGTGENVVGVLVVDKTSWERVASHDVYGPKLKSEYQKLRNAGNHLYMIDGLHQKAVDKVDNMEDNIKAVGNIIN